MKPAIAIISNTQTPYRLHVHGRVAHELTECRLLSVFTHDLDQKLLWQLPPTDWPVELFGPGDSPTRHSFWHQGGHEWAKGGRVIEYLRRNEVRAIVMEGYHDPGRVRIIRWCRRQGVPCFLWGDSNIHGERSRGWRRWVKGMFVPRILGSCTGVLACGSAGKAYFMKYGVPEERIFYYPPEPDFELLAQTTAQDIADAQAKFALAPQRRRIVYSGRLASHKRVDLVVEAFVQIAAARPEWDLLLIGNGPAEANLRARVAAAGLEARVIFTGFVDQQRTINALYRSGEVFVLASEYEPWALVILEAAASGLALVSTNVVGAAVDLVREGVNGRMFPPGDKAALAACLLDVTTRAAALGAASGTVLAEWRAQRDPVLGLRRALAYAGVIAAERSA